VVATTVKGADGVKPAHAQQSAALATTDAVTAINGGADLYGTALSKGLCGRNHRVGGNKDHHQKGDKKSAPHHFILHVGTEILCGSIKGNSPADHHPGWREKGWRRFGDLAAAGFEDAAVMVTVAAILHAIAGLGDTNQCSGSSADRRASESAPCIAADCSAGQSADRSATDAIAGRSPLISGASCQGKGDDRCHQCACDSRSHLDLLLMSMTSR
jgi:hypothetical protein